MPVTGDRFTLEEEKFRRVVRALQEDHPDATEDDIRVILLDDLLEENHQEWLDQASEDEITDYVRQHLENTRA